MSAEQNGPQTLKRSNERTYKKLPAASLINTVVSKLITDRLFFWEDLLSNYRYRIALPEELISITETDLLIFQQKISHCRYRLSLEVQLISITATGFRLKTN